MAEYMKALVIYLLFGLSVCGGVYAQTTSVPSPTKLDEYMESGMEVDGVRAPYYDDDGVLRAQLYGGHAKVLDGGVADVSNLRVDVFKEGVVVMTLFAPQCFTKVEASETGKVLSVYSEGEVLIEMDQMTIVGRGFNFSSAQNRFEILHDSKVLVKESVRAMPELKL